MEGFDFKVALFDLDGVVLDTESQYSEFYGAIGREFHPETPDFAQRIKGMTLEQIYGAWFDGQPDVQAEITRRLNVFEANMKYNYIEGFPTFIQELRAAGIKTAIVTASNDEKMQSVYRAHPELLSLFDRILTAKDYAASKPAPDCYLRAAELFGADPSACVVFEDSINGLKAGRAAGAFVVGLTTTNPEEKVAPLADITMADFTGANHRLHRFFNYEFDEFGEFLARRSQLDEL
ncbi:MAG: HAD family phosphatase [Bacteroidaceae bacterium]|nr:HAD family phosphatase [Bacteroidaceae bacterium]